MQLLCLLSDAGRVHLEVARTGYGWQHNLHDMKETEEKVVTTEERKPLRVPESVHVRISPDNLKDYVGPPIYYKDRLYVFPPPPGVSTGLGYLGNGSGAVMPIEAAVCVDVSC